jgi:gamma-glutamylcyclotransferase (GGCT)/AIG2-like uncharacterized protein YtfP
MSTTKIYAYGTLREGQYNFKRIQDNFGKESIRKVEETTLNEFDMYSINNWYPAIVHNKEGGTIVVEVLEVSPQAKAFIDSMESGAGYDIMEVNGIPIYYYSTNKFNENSKINSGDWVKYINSVK